MRFLCSCLWRILTVVLSCTILACAVLTFISYAAVILTRWTL